MRNLSAALILTIAIGASAQEITYTRFLVPQFTAPVPGAHESLWEVRNWMHYSGDQEVNVVPRPFCFGIQCTLGGTIFPGLSAFPLESLPGFRDTGVLVHVDSRYASFMTFASRVRDVSRDEQSAGTEIPVVREDQLLATPLRLLNIPVDSRFRVMLRLYALPEVALPVVEVRYFRLPDPSGTTIDLEPVLLREERVALRTTATGGAFQLHPSAAQIPELQSLPELVSEDAIWIEVVPVTAGLRIWAFVTITNNDTQQVTVVSPMP